MTPSEAQDRKQIFSMPFTLGLSLFVVGAFIHLAAPRLIETEIIGTSIAAKPGAMLFALFALAVLLLSFYLASVVKERQKIQNEIVLSVFALLPIAAFIMASTSSVLAPSVSAAEAFCSESGYEAGAASLGGASCQMTTDEGYSVSEFKAGLKFSSEGIVFDFTPYA